MPPPASSIAGLSSALAREDLGFSGAVAWVARHYAAGSPAATALLEQLSRRPDAAIAAPISDSRVAISSSIAGANGGVSPHGPALRQLERAVAGLPRAAAGDGGSDVARPRARR